MSNTSEKGGIKRRNLDYSLQDLLFDSADQRDQVALREGVKASNVLYIPANVVNGDTITVGDDIFEVDIINTDSGVNTHAVSGALNDTDVESLVILTAAPATAISAGDVLGIEIEMLLVIRKLDTTHYVCERGYAGTTTATHAANTDVLVSDTVPTNISVPLVTTLTPAAFAVSFVGVFNWTVKQNETAPARTPTIAETLTAYSLGSKAQVLIVADEAGVDTTATTEDFAASTDNVWANATMSGGIDPAVAGIEVASRAVSSAEALVGEMHFAFPFDVRAAAVEVRLTTTGQKVSFTGEVKIGYAETTTEVLPASIVTLRNNGAASTAYITIFDSTMTVTVVASE